MLKSKFLLVGMLSALSIFALAEKDPEELVAEHYHHYPLQEFTAMELTLVPDQATRLIFPFQLDSESFDPRIKYEITPSDVFATTRIDQINGQNVLVLENTLTGSNIQAMRSSSGGSYVAPIGTFFLSVGGYNLSIRLKAGLKVEEQKANIVFDLTEEEREHLIAMEVQRHEEALDRQLEQERSRLDEMAQEKALLELSAIVSAKPDSQPLRYEVASEDESLIYYADRTETYQDAYHSLFFTVENDGPETIYIEDIRHYAIEGETSTLIDGQTTCTGRLERRANQDCAFLTLDPSITTASRVRVEIVTPDGIQEVVW